MSVVEIKTKPESDRASVIETLEAALQEAKEGRILAVAVAVVRPAQFVGTSWSTSDFGSSLLGAVTLCAHRLIRRLDE